MSKNQILDIVPSNNRYLYTINNKFKNKYLLIIKYL